MEKIYGVICVVIAAIAFGVMPILAKLAYNTGINTYMVLFFRFFFAAILLFIYMITTKKKIFVKLKKEQIIYIILLGIIGNSFTALGLFLSYNYISLGMATTIHFIYPMLVTLGAVFVYKEKLTLRKIICVIMAAIGVYFLVGIGNNNINLTGVIFAFLSAISYAAYILGVGSKILKGLDNVVITFYLSLISSVSMLFLALGLGKFSVNCDNVGIIYCFFIAFISTAIALLLFLKGIRMIGPSTASILSTLECVVSVILGVFIFKENMNFYGAFGVILVILAAILVVIQKKNLEKVS